MPGKHVRCTGELGECCLATLAWAMDQHDRRIVVRLDKQALDGTWVEFWARHRPIESKDTANCKIEVRPNASLQVGQLKDWRGVCPVVDY